jgi:hypothetical protein
MNRVVLTSAYCAVWMLWLTWSSSAEAATQAERKRAAAEMLQAALRCEIDGSNLERNRLLQSALEQVPNYAPALWQSGYVRHGKRWLKYDELPQLLADDQRLGAYEQKRDSSPDTVDGQLTLARWCTKHQLSDQARAHLTRALELNPEHAAARQLAGYRRMGGVWVSGQEIAQAAARMAELAKGLNEWRTRLEEIRRGLTRPGDRQRQAAAERLLAIDDPAAIPAIELTFFGANEEFAVLVVETLGGMAANEASVALARQAVFSPAESVRGLAAQKLASRDQHSYVPALLAAMSTPIQSRAGLYVTGNGRLTYRHLLFREEQYRAQQVAMDSEYDDPILFANGVSGVGRRNALAGILQQDAAGRARNMESAVAMQNVVIEELNRRICEALATATGHDLPPSPESWWQWWNDYNEVYLAGDKPVYEIYNRQQVSTPPPVSMGECLIAGTLVWTASGPMPIEQIKVGDLVLSQNPTTSELAYKSVLRTTLRPPERLVKLVIGDKALQCTGGHPFWIAGQGWVKARVLEEGAYLHTVDGIIAVRSVHGTGIEETHNLIVADFHSYFVTEAKLLTHDNTIRQPTDTVVPGLLRP